MPHVEGDNDGIGYGLYGRSVDAGYGVQGYSGSGYPGVFGQSNSGPGVQGNSNRSAAVVSVILQRKYLRWLQLQTTVTAAVAAIITTTVAASKLQEVLQV
jgi:hypothetical protein